ncbi:endonuclease/exonuclease/phosphatase family protein [Mariprofundus ferrooxydans]|uniref:endonuclease/exonuclease/phosphatase family protein n=1 Tax=Mariprofundus ferrooxydans TaxID=314344 RepID=UPI0012DC5FE5|nr:endonuclease/exonuclease/phosphatase family protein [Mariprofundus ferrooxydans]
MAISGWLMLFMVTGEQYTVIRWLSYVAPWMAGILLICAMAVLLLRRWWQGAMVTLLAVLLLLPYMPRFMPSGSANIDAQATHRQVYKVMTYSKMGRNHDIDAVARAIAAEKPDILFMQEISSVEAGQLAEHLKQVYGERLSSVNNHAGFIFSRFKVEAKNDNTGSAVLALPEGNVRVWNVHLQKSFRNTDIQYKGVDLLSDAVAKATGPVLVAGDFNATTINYPCIVMSQYLDDAFEQAGFGFGFTFPSPARRMGLITPFMRIDHIYYSTHFVVQNVYVADDAGGSDHYPVVALLSLKRHVMSITQ